MMVYYVDEVKSVIGEEETEVFWFKFLNSFFLIAKIFSNICFLK